jgi:Uma2 family endonuclease
MSFVIDDAYLPATLNSQPMTDEEFATFCSEHPDLRFEMTADGELIVMPPTQFLSGTRNTGITAELFT